MSRSGSTPRAAARALGITGRHTRSAHRTARLQERRSGRSITLGHEPSLRLTRPSRRYGQLTVARLAIVEESRADCSARGGQLSRACTCMMNGRLRANSSLRSLRRRLAPYLERDLEISPLFAREITTLSAGI